MMAQNLYKDFVMTQLKDRNQKESCFKEIIHHSNRLLGSLDYMQKENILKKLGKTIDEIHVTRKELEQTRANEISNALKKCCSLQEELSELHKKNCDYAQQLIELKVTFDDKCKQLETQDSKLEKTEKALFHSQQLCKNYQEQLSELKRNLQDKIDEWDALNITFSSIDNKKHELEIENNKLKSQLMKLKAQEELYVKKPEVHNVNVQPEQQLPVRRASIELSTYCLDAVIPKLSKYEFNAHDSEVNAVSWVPSRAEVITAGADRKVKIWELTSKGMVLQKSARDCNSAIMSIDINYEADLLLCSSWDFASRIWTISDFITRHTFTGHSGKVMSAKFLNEANKVVSGSVDQTLKLWDLRRRVCTHTYFANSGCNDVLNKGGHSIISCHNDKIIRFWDIRSNNTINQITTKEKVTSLDLSKDGILLLTSVQDDSLKLFDLRKCEEMKPMTANDFNIASDWTRAKFSPDSQYCSCGSKSGSVFIWNVPSGVLQMELKGHESPVLACSWSSCSSYLTSCDKNKKCIIWSDR